VLRIFGMRHRGEADGRAWGLRIDMETRSWGVGRAYVMR
jgi:hypothetical protein